MHISSAQHHEKYLIIKLLYLELQTDYCNYYLGLTLEFPIIQKYEIRYGTEKGALDNE